MKLFGYPKSRATRVTWALEELGFDYEYQLVDLMKGEGRGEAFLAVNPSGKVPALQDGDLLLIESAAIVTYLADKQAAQQPQQRMIPEVGTAQRARHDQWAYFVMSELEQPLWTMGKHRFALPEKWRVKEIFPTAQWEFKRALKLLSNGLADKAYILGDECTVVDIMIAHTLIWGQFFEQDIAAENLQAYLARMKARPAFKAAIEREKAALQA